MLAIGLPIGIALAGSSLLYMMFDPMLAELARHVGQDSDPIIRQKLADAQHAVRNHPPLRIETIRGVGYRLVAGPAS